MNEQKNHEIIFAHGHENIIATHRSTLEFTKEKHLSEAGNCIVAVAASKGISDLNREFKDNLRMQNARITIVVEAEEVSDSINAYGSPKLILTHPSDIVIRKSNHIDSRTLAIKADKAAKDLNRDLIERIRKPKQKVKIILGIRC